MKRKISIHQFLEFKTKTMTTELRDKEFGGRWQQYPRKYRENGRKREERQQYRMKGQEKTERSVKKCEEV
jgi:hypothetical protein